MAYTTIDDPSVYFQTLLYTGNATGSRALTNDGNSDLQPDWLWIKQRNSAKNNNIWDSTRGVTKQLRTNLNNAEATNTTDDQIVSLNSDGFTLGDDTDSVGVNENSQTYVAWQWKANGGTTSSNSDGSITSTVQANTTAGFSIITYTGTGSTATIGHGLNSAPEMIITKGRSDAHSWLVGVTADSSDLSSVLVLQTTAASVTATSNYNAAPNSSTYQVVNAGGTNNNADTYVAYVFHSVQGYSKIGSYTGNGNADGPFVYLGFKPAWVMVKRTNTTGAWEIYDSARNGNDSNPINDRLRANDNAAENTDDTSDYVSDFLSNGWKIRTNSGNWNTSGHTYIYMAFAEHPFVSSEGVPVTAR
jgi:hypothetical protein